MKIDKIILENNVESIEKRFLDKVNKTENCWVWIANINPYGYGRFSCNGRTVMAHRFSYESYVENIKPNYLIDHICRNRACVNPKHLRQVTARINSLENSLSVSAINYNKKFCSKGHAYNDENTVRWNHGKQRVCKTCKKEWYKKGELIRRSLKNGKFFLKKEIKEYILKNKISQISIGYLLGIHASQLSTFMNAKRQVPKKHHNKLAKILGIEKQELFKKENRK